MAALQLGEPLPSLRPYLSCVSGTDDKMGLGRREVGGVRKKDSGQSKVKHTG